ncbi:SacI homology domain-containing protein [Limtongia smithiae]|uniref:SacI homology domain-containing protein n=1 Tax=Limtongia smithiae TaxID=1125753 RepID=UPI0034CE0245
MSAPLHLSAYAAVAEVRFINNLTSPPTVLHISKPSGIVSTSKVVDESEIDDFAAFGPPVPGILGLIQLRFGKYIIVVTKSEKVGLIRGHVVYRIVDFDFVALRDGAAHDKDEASYIALLKRHVKSGPMYFSYTWDLTNSMQRQQDSNSLEPLWKRADPRFFWNRFAQSEFIDYSNAGNPDIDHFILPVVYGYINLTKASIKGMQFTFGLISRRSRFRAGTRYFSRGIDAQGNVSNFNETEQLLILDSVNEDTYSFVQTRGSVPVYWAEINNLRYKPKLRVFDTAFETARLHFNQQKMIYGANYCVNLVNQKGHEQPVKSAYESAIKLLNDPEVVYIYFDFHHECKGMKWHRVQLLIDKLVDLGADKMGWYQSSQDAEKQTPVVKKSQTAVVRTNCMDCLDRTNVVQSMLAGWTLQKQLEDARVLVQGEHWEDNAEFMNIFRNVWADNADFISKAYSGTGALKTDFTRTGKRTKQGALNDLRNSIERYTRNNFFDGPRQDAYDLFLGNHLPYDVADAPFADHRPLLVQSMPYISYGALMMISAAVFLPRKQNDARLSIRLFIGIWLVVLGYSVYFIQKHGLAYVNWPRLVPLDYVSEQEVVHSGSGKIKGWVMSEKSKIESKIRGLEEGKKRTE